MDFVVRRSRDDHEGYYTQDVVAHSHVEAIRFARRLARRFHGVMIVISVQRRTLVDFFMSVPIHALRIYRVRLVVCLLPSIIRSVFALAVETMVRRDLGFG